MDIPVYFPQEHNYTCSLAVLRMVLAANTISVSEMELVDLVTPLYGSDFKNLWNPTIVKLARQYGIPTSISALWDLFKPGVMDKAISEYEHDPEHFNYRRYENSKDANPITEPLPLSYQEMFTAYTAGCTATYGRLTKQRIVALLDQQKLIQTSIKLDKLYPGKKATFHSILIYGYTGDEVHYHDPAHGAELKTSFDHLLGAATDVGAFMAYSIGK